MFTIQFDETLLSNIEQKFEEFPEEAHRGFALAINRVSNMAKTRMIRNATKTYTVKYGELLKNLTVRKAFPHQLIGQIHSRGNYLGLDNFQLNPSTRQGRTSVTAAVKSGSAFSLNDNTFIAYRDGHLGAFERTGSGRLPIQRKYGPSAPQMLGPTNSLPDLEEFINKKTEERFFHELSRILLGIGGRKKT